MFNNPRYITRGFASDLSPRTLCDPLGLHRPDARREGLPASLQGIHRTSQTVFTHSQEQPPYSRTYRFTIDFSFTGPSLSSMTATIRPCCWPKNTDRKEL